MKSVKINPEFEDLNNPDTFIKHLEKIKQNEFKSKDSKEMLIVKEANQWMDEAKNRPIPKMLFSGLWFENELCILFADTNLGKTILAVQIADSISSGTCIPGFKLEAQKQVVLYFDFELSDKQFQNRYSIDFDNNYIFDENFLRVELDPDAEIPEKESVEKLLHDSFERAIIKSGAKILIIDNITYLKNETERAKDALPLMKFLKSLKSKYGLSILALAHTPKRDLSKPITGNDLQGSKMLLNFVDSCFAIGENHLDKSKRYLIQIKVRNTEKIYDSENVVTCQIQKPSNFLEFIFVGYGSEREHLRKLTDEGRELLIDEAKELSKQGKSQRDIAKILSIGASTVNKYLKK